MESKVFLQKYKNEQLFILLAIKLYWNNAK